ncbi:hypothetical protein KOI35_30195 [Actinoplanes bogorensis]|uniref:PIN domain-containing protein n=1 Tax=Paractinoplanes bogorensis TaxID=1610840 RepID=A0ABS5YXJ8_9ACTN|nr:PIN domain-containing protein [Actinoplanes bogorensis]MBU2667791.1 hypothetical protein [Actinoplanes bogorensis]
MLVTLEPGADRNYVLGVLDRAVVEIDSPHPNNNVPYGGYVAWILGLARMLRGHIADADLEGLIYTPGLDRLLAGVGAGTMKGQHVFNDEKDARRRVFTTAANNLRDQIARWSVHQHEVLSVVDTNVFLHHPGWHKDPSPQRVLGSIPWALDLKAGHADIKLVLPEVVVRELDRHKESSNKVVRFRAQVTLAALARLLQDPFAPVVLREHGPQGAADDEPGGQVTLRVFYDDPAHRPVDDEDTEILQRALALQSLASHDVVVFTTDVTMALNARRFGMKTAIPERPIEDPDDAPPSNRQQRRERQEAAYRANS